MNRPKLAKTALVLAGGGITGAVYEIGALRAIDDMLTDRTVNDFDIYVGTSAGALVASLLANQVSPETMFKVIEGSHPYIYTLRRQDIFGIDRRYWLHWGAQLPLKLVSAWGNYLFHRRDMTLFDFLWSLSSALPPGIYDSMSLERFTRRVLSEDGRSNHFEQLENELYVIATDLDSGERVVFGRHPVGQEAPISLAVAASSALPLVYKPVRIENREYVDGGLRGNASLDLAIERGATLVVCINPMVPVNYHLGDTSQSKQAQHLLSEQGVRLIAEQTLRIASYSSLQYHIKQLRRRHPAVDIILIEPRADDSSLFSENLMEYSSRLEVAWHGFESVTLDLSADYPMYKEILNRHEIPISRRLVIDELAHISSSREKSEAIRKVLEAYLPGCGQGNSSLCRLSRILSDLEYTLDHSKQGDMYQA